MKTLIPADEIRDAVARLGADVTREYTGQPLTVLGVLSGSLVFLADLIRAIDLPLRIGLLQASSYRGTATSPGPLVLNEELLPNLEGRHVLLVDDIFDTGHTLEAVVALIRERGAASVRTAVLLRKQGRREVLYEPDRHLFGIPNEFVVGYGLDYADEYRHLPHVAVLEPEDLRPNDPS